MLSFFKKIFMETPENQNATPTQGEGATTIPPLETVVNIVKYDPNNREVISRAEGDKVVVSKPSTGASKEFDRVEEQAEAAESYFNFLVNDSQQQ
jgi:hypothetical protein